jgi:hypothetical protein
MKCFNETIELCKALIFLLSLIYFFLTFKEDEIGRACSRNVEKRNAYRILVEKLEETTRKTKTWMGG